MDISVRSDTYLAEDRSWLASEHGTDATRSITLDISAFTEATHYPDGHIPSGVVLAFDSVSGLGVPYDDAFDADPATAGQQPQGHDVAVGHLYTSVQVRPGGGNHGAALLEHGFVVEANLPANSGLDAAAQTDLAGWVRYR